jgi:hypothetical protein
LELGEAVGLGGEEVADLDGLGGVESGLGLPAGGEDFDSGEVKGGGGGAIKAEGVDALEDGFGIVEAGIKQKGEGVIDLEGGGGGELLDEAEGDLQGFGGCFAKDEEEGGAVAQGDGAVGLEAEELVGGVAQGGEFAGGEGGLEGGFPIGGMVAEIGAFGGEQLEGGGGASIAGEFGGDAEGDAIIDDAGFGEALGDAISGVGALVGDFGAVFGEEAEDAGGFEGGGAGTDLGGGDTDVVPASGIEEEGEVGFPDGGMVLGSQEDALEEVDGFVTEAEFGEGDGVIGGVVGESGVGLVGQGEAAGVLELADGSEQSPAEDVLADGVGVVLLEAVEGGISVGGLAAADGGQEEETGGGDAWGTG